MNFGESFCGSQTALLFADFFASLHVRFTVLLTVAALWNPHQGEHSDSGQRDWSLSLRALLHLLLRVYR